MLYDLVVIGGGSAGLAAAIEARDNGVENILVIERDRELGGILQQCIHNGFGLHVFKEELTGPEYAQRFVDELKKRDIEFLIDAMVLDIDENNSVHAISKKHGYQVIETKTVVLAMGCRERTAGAIGIPGDRPAGVFTAGTAQRYINMEGYMVGKKIVILGSGDIGLIMARRMVLEGAEVLAVVELLEFSGGLQRNIAQCLDDFDIPLFLSHTVVNVIGEDRVEKIVIAKVDENRKPIANTEIEYECDTLLLSVGLIPENEISNSIGIDMDRVTGGPVVNELMETSMAGVFACGNVVHVHDLVDFVTYESKRAGESVAKYLKGSIDLQAKRIDTVAGNGVSYIVPQKISIENIDRNLELFLRVKNVYKDSKIVIKSGENIIRTIKKSHMAPAEMEIIKLRKSQLSKFDLENLIIEIV